MSISCSITITIRIVEPRPRQTSVTLFHDMMATWQLVVYGSFRLGRHDLQPGTVQSLPLATGKGPRLHRMLNTTHFRNNISWVGGWGIGPYVYIYIYRQKKEWDVNSCSWWTEQQTKCRNQHGKKQEKSKPPKTNTNTNNTQENGKQDQNTNIPS